MITEMLERTHPQKRFAMSMASSREKLVSSPVKTKESPARQSGAAVGGTGFEPGLGGPAILAAFTAAQLERKVFKKERKGRKRKGLVLEFGLRVRTILNFMFHFESVFL